MIIGLTGPMASGKSTVVDVLKKRNFKYYRLSDVIREECKKRGLEIERFNLMKVGQSLREVFGASVLIKRALKHIEQENHDGDWIVDGIRNPAEVEELRRAPDFVLIANTAPEELIIKRILARKREDDTLDESAIRIKLRREMGEGEPPEGQQVQKCIDMADYTFKNTMPMNEVETQFMTLYNRINDER